MTRRERWIPYAFLLPAIVGLLIFRLLPTVYSIGRSLYATSFGFHPSTYCLQVKVLSHMSSTRISAARGGKGSVAAYTPYFHEPFAPTHGCRYAMRLMRLCNITAIRLA